MVVAEDADLDLAVEGALFSGFGTAGQRCTSLGTVIVHESVHEDFLRRFDAAARAAPIGDPRPGRGVRPDARRAVRRAVREVSRLDRGHPTYGSTGDRPDHAGQPAEGFVGDPDAGALLPPGDRRRRDAPDDELFRQETFGPIVA